MMWNKMAEMSLQHLKPNDFIYVSGKLDCYTKAARDGQLRAYYKVEIVPEVTKVSENVFRNI